MKKSNGITLIALVVTIIVLIILSGVTLNLVFSENGIIQKAKTAKLEQTKAQILENLELAKSKVIFEGEGNTELGKYLNYIDGKKLNGFEVTSVEKIDEANAIIWVEWQYKYKAAQVGTDVIINADGYILKADLDKPNKAEITIEGNTTQTSLPVTLTTKIVQTDTDSGINIAACKYILNQSAEELGTDSSKYSEEFNNDDETITITLTEEGDWYLHVLSTDNTGKALETIEGPINVSAKYHVHTGSSSIGGGCYTKGSHVHTSSCTKTCSISVSKTNYRDNEYPDNTSGIIVCDVYETHSSCGQGTKIYTSTVSSAPSSGTHTYTGCGNSPINSWSINCGKTEGVTIEEYEVSY